MKSILFALFALSTASAFAQVGVDSQSQAGASAQLGDVIVNMPASSPVQGVRYSGDQTVRTTGQAFLPGMAVSSGGFNCGGTSGLAIGGTGFAVSGGTSKEMDGCLALNAAVLYGQKGDAKMFDAVMCELAPVKAAQRKLGFDCDTLQPIPAPVASAAPAYSGTDPYIARRLGR